MWLKRLVLFVALVVVGYEVYRYLLDNIFGGRQRIISFVLLWAFTAYLVLPRIYRALTKVFIPDYFIGRTKTADGIFGDPINLALRCSKRQLQEAMARAGWQTAEPATPKSALRVVYATMLKKSYPTAPMSNLYLFGRRQDLAYQQQVNGNPKARHHVRFWKTPKHWWLPGGLRADWVGAATYDRAVGFSFFTGQVTHRIAEHVDEERDFVVASLRQANPNVKVDLKKHYMSSFSDRNGGGDRIQTDGSLPLLYLN